MTCRNASLRTLLSRITVVMITLVLLSGCARTNTKWTHPEIPPDEWRVDAAQCKWEARKKAEKEAEDAMAHTSGDDIFDNGQNVDAMFATADINKRARLFFARCMTSLGYIAEE